MKKYTLKECIQAKKEGYHAEWVFTNKLWQEGFIIMSDNLFISKFPSKFYSKKLKYSSFKKHFK